MIVFHGTVEENLKSIKKNGILDATKDQWLLEVTDRKVCCVSSQPTSGEGGNASYFAYGNPNIKNQDGYLVFADIPRAVLDQKVIAIFDNKTLDDYVRLHFFLRQEFSQIGYRLFQKLSEYREKDRHFVKLNESIASRPGNENDLLLFSPQDQRRYYKKLREEEDRRMYDILGIEVTDDFFHLTQYIRTWEPFYEFLLLHYERVSPSQHQAFSESFFRSYAEYWRTFYAQFPMNISDPRKKSFEQWFSPQWLSERKSKEVGENCQVLLDRVEPEYIKGAIKITTPSGFAASFRSCRSKAGFVSQVWKEVHQILKKES